MWVLGNGNLNPPKNEMEIISVYDGLVRETYGLIAH